MDLFTKLKLGAIYKPAVATSRSCAKCESTAVSAARAKTPASSFKEHQATGMVYPPYQQGGSAIWPEPLPYNPHAAAWGGARGVTIPAESPLAQSGYQPIMEDLRKMVEQCVQEAPTLCPGETRASWRQRCIDMDIGDAIYFYRVAETIAERMKLTFMRRAERGEGLLDSGRAFVQGQAHYLFDEAFTRRTTVEARFGADARGYRIVVVELSHTLFHSGHELKAAYTLT
ncbi:MAG: hypothetical protein RLZZ450_91 [Pseudomonadota bacterium]|jgi:hypothetical protein